MDEPPPSIRVSHHHRYHSPPTPRSSRHSPLHNAHAPASPMSIPNAAKPSPVPPPLPPPTHIYEDLTSPAQQKEWILFNKDYVDQHWTDFGKSATVRPGSSLLGGKRSNPGSDGEEQAHDEIDQVRRGSSISTVTASHRKPDHMDERVAPCDQDDGSSKPSGHRLQSERQLEQRSLSTSSQAYDRNLLSKIGGPNTPNRLSVSQPSPGGPENPAMSPGADSRSDTSRHLSVSSEKRHPSIDSSSFRWSVSSAAVSPGLSRLDPENSRPPALRHSSFPFDDHASHRSSYDQSMFLHEDFHMEEGQMKDLNLNDRSPSVSDEFQLAAKAGMKRRASSPHRESAREDRSSVSSAPGGSDLYTRRSIQQYPNRNSSISASRFAPNHGSISSASSYNPRNGSLASSYSLSIASSATSYASGRISPGMMSPAIDPDLGNMPFPTNKPLSTAPGTPQAIASHPRTLSETPANPLQPLADCGPQSRHNSIPNAQGIFLCDCCPKKPKKFGSEEELREHYMEKQYGCLYCPNRFKNKNEAERHQNSVHLRRHSWSCAVLSAIETTFHANPKDKGATDVCGFCGERFPNPPDWDRRRDHVCQAHKFGECNQTKKFFRADHFRQHLKHSHAGTSGKWTNMLEAMCMREEPPPQQMSVGHISSGAISNTTATVPMAGMPNTAGPPMGKPDVIDEVPHES